MEKLVFGEMVFNHSDRLPLSPYIEIEGSFKQMTKWPFGWGILCDLRRKWWSLGAPVTSQRQNSLHFYKESNSILWRIYLQGASFSQENQRQQGHERDASSKDFYSVGFSEDVAWKKKSRDFWVYVTYSWVLLEMTIVNLIGVMMCYSHVDRGPKCQMW